MNQLEKKMVSQLVALKENYHVVAVKAEFEAEGTRMAEAMRLKDIASAAGLGLNIKVGGCEAITDMLDAKCLGAERIIGPMIETPYALKKFIQACQFVFGESLEDIEILANIETITACNSFSKMLELPEIQKLKGIVIGRVDFVGSMGWSRDSVNSPELLKLCIDLAEKAHQKGLDVVCGGGVSIDAKPFLNAYPKGVLTRFETRKVIFGCPAALDNPEIAYIKAVGFELNWLKNKQSYYGAIAREDQARIEMMEKRYHAALESVKQHDEVSV